jgi:hypothetical protein
MTTTTATATDTILGTCGVLWVCYAEPGETREEHARRVARMRVAYDAAVERAVRRGR